MRNKYSIEFESEIEEIATTKTLVELLEIAQNKYNYNITKNQLRQYLSKREIKYKDYDIKKVRDMGKYIPIGTEFVKPDGMTLIKISKDKWVYKQRYIYEQYYGVKLTSNYYIIFMDQDRTNFSIDNLRKITRHESSILSNQKMFSTNKDLTNLGIITAKLMIKTNNKKRELKKTNK